MPRNRPVVLRFRKDALQAASLFELNAIFGECIRTFGFNAYAVGFIEGAGETGENVDPFLLLDWPRPWLELYAREGFAQDDATVAEARLATEAFTWKELQERRPGASARIFAAARRFGWNDGLTIPVSVGTADGGRRLGMVSLAAPTLDGLGPGDRASVVAIGTRAFARAEELSSEARGVALSERERHAVSLVATGRSDREIASIMNVSVTTAHFHVEQAKRKLGAVTRAQAVAIAINKDLVRSP